MAKKRSTRKRLRALEQRLLTLEREHADVTKRVKQLSKRIDALPDPKAIFGKGFGERGFPFEVPFPGPGGPGGPGGAGGHDGPNFLGRRPGGGPSWRKRFGPVVSLEVPLETDDPSAPLWATVAARLPEEITTVGDDGAVVCYRYSAAGSTPQAPRYRRVAEPAQAFPATGPPPP